MPKVGPWEGCLTQANTFIFSWEPRAWHKPMVVVDLPSPSGVGVIPATHTYLPFCQQFMNKSWTFSWLFHVFTFLVESLLSVSSDTFAFFFPYKSTSDDKSPISLARRSMSLGVWSLETSISEGTFSLGLRLRSSRFQFAFWASLKFLQADWKYLKL